VNAKLLSVWQQVNLNKQYIDQEAKNRGTMTSTILKVACEGHIYRVPFKPELGLAATVAAVSKLVTSASDGMLTFGEHSPQLLTETTYDDFLAQGKVGPAGGTAFRVQLQLPGGHAALDTSPAPVGDHGTISSGESSACPRRQCSGAVRRAQRRQAKTRAAAAASRQWEEDPRDLDLLTSALEGEAAPPSVPPRKPTRQQGKATKAKQQGSALEANAAEETQGVAKPLGGADTAAHLVCNMQNLLVEGSKESELYEEGQGEADEMMPTGARSAYQALAASSLQAATGHDAMLSLADKASECATESTCGDVGDDDVHEEAAPDVESESSDLPVELWPPTPESTPPSSPRCFRNQFQPVYWVPVPVWIPAMQ